MSQFHSKSALMLPEGIFKCHIDWKGEKLGVFETRRHYTNYFKGIPNFKEYRTKMVTSDDASDVFAAFDEVLEKFAGYQFKNLEAS